MMETQNCDILFPNDDSSFLNVGAFFALQLINQHFDAVVNFNVNMEQKYPNTYLKDAVKNTYRELRHNLA